MLCMSCQQNEATIHLTEIANNQMVEVHLCESCAEEKGADFKSQFNFGELLFLSRGQEESEGRKNSSLLADTFEAFLGALFLDQGIEKAQRFLEQYLFTKTSHVITSKSYIDFKSLLQEIIQEKSRISPTYRVTKTEGPDHSKTFWVEAVMENNVLGIGKGKSKQEAEQQAATDALEKLGKI